MPEEGVLRPVQRRGVPQAEAIAARFGQETLGSPTELASGILPSAKVTRVDWPMLGGVEVAALAANRSMIQLLNPAKSNTDVFLKRIWFSRSSAGAINIRTRNATLLTLATSSASLFRQEGTSQIAPIAQIRTAQSAAVGGNIATYELEADIMELITFEVGDGQEFDGFLLQPGRGFLVAPDADNIAIRATFHWLERPTG